jgi:hypothetical protein
LTGCATRPEWAPDVGIWGYLRDARGAPVCAFVEVFRPDGTMVFPVAGPNESRFCTGQFAIALDPGLYRLHARELGYWIADLSVTVPSGGASFVDVRLEARAPLPTG